jgi:hypothetical protein
MDKFEEILNTLETENKEVHQNYLLKFTKNWYWFAIFAFIGIVAGFALFHYTAPTFLVQSKLLIPSDENAQKTLLSFENQILPKNQKIENQIGTLQSFSLYKKALENLNWKTSYFLEKGNYKIELYERDRIPILTNENDIIWVVGMRSSKKFLKDKGTKEVIIINYGENI